MKFYCSVSILAVLVLIASPVVSFADSPQPKMDAEFIIGDTVQLKSQSTDDGEIQQTLWTINSDFSLKGKKVRFQNKEDTFTVKLDVSDDDSNVSTIKETFDMKTLIKEKQKELKGRHKRSDGRNNRSS